MSALITITSRVSAKRLHGEIPPAIHIAAMLACATNAPDHGRIRPWRFIKIEGQGLDALAQLFAEASCNANTAAAEHSRKRAYLAPLVFVAVECLRRNTKIPEFEQTLSVGAATENLILAARALGYGVMWKTGALAYDPVVRDQLGLAENERIAGFIYVGDSESESQPRSRMACEQFVTSWP